ncbi:Aldehyde/histidinol dehydrogenase, partial [Suillus subluteus]
GDYSEAYFIPPTTILTRDPESITEEIFKPDVLTTFQVYVYDDTNHGKTLELIDDTSLYPLTGSIFATDCKALVIATNKLQNAAGSVYYNKKFTGAVVGQHPFGGARASGTNNKVGSISIFYQFVCFDKKHERELRGPGGSNSNTRQT